MTNSELGAEHCYLKADEERILALFTRRFIEVATISAKGSLASPTALLNVMSVPAIALDRQGFVLQLNAAAEAIFGDDFKIKERRLFVRDPAARALLKKAIEQLKKPRLLPPVIKPFVVTRENKFPLVLRIWPFPGGFKKDFAASPIHAILSLLPVVHMGRQTAYLM